MSGSDSRSAKAALAKQTVDIVNQGAYINDRNQTVIFSDALAICHLGTQYFSRDIDFPPLPDPRFNTVVNIREQTTLEAGRALAAANRAPLALNFASGKNPGGGFLRGTSGQEESLVSSSALYSSLSLPSVSHYYTNNNHLDKPLDWLFTSGMIYSPNCPVFRDDNGDLLDNFYVLSFLSCPAPNLGAAKDKGHTSLDYAMEALKERAKRILHAAAILGHDSLVLGAWGCGVYRNDPAFVAATFQQLLDGPFIGQFREVVFAVVGSETFRAFHNQFHGFPSEQNPPRGRTIKQEPSDSVSLLDED